MKAKILDVKYKGEYNNSFGVNHGYSIKYEIDGVSKTGLCSFKTKDQTKFVKGAELDIVEVPMVSQNGKPYTKIALAQGAKYSNFTKKVQQEQSRYTTMGTSYVKDLIIAGKIDIKDWASATEKIVKFMFKLDQEIEK